MRPKGQPATMPEKRRKNNVEKKTREENEKQGSREYAREMHKENLAQGCARFDTLY